MNEIKKICIYGLTTLLLCIGFSSCKKHDVTADDLSSYVAHNLSAYRRIPINIEDTAVVNLGVLLPGAKKSGFFALLETPLSSDVEINARVDNNPELIRIYDSLYQTKSPVLPDSLFKIAGSGKVSVKAGSVQSTDSITITVNNPKNLQPGKYLFIVPIALESTSKNAKLKSKLMFVRYKLNVLNLSAFLTGFYGNFDVFVPYDVVNPDIEIWANSNLSIPQPVNVEVEADNTKTFVDAYNAANGTAYLPFPEGAYTFEKSTVIPAHNMSSGLPIQVKLTNRSLFNLSRTYMLALKIKDSNLADPEGDMVFIKMFNNNLDMKNTGLSGGTKLDRKGWKVSASTSLDSSVPPAQVLDGNNSTSWVSGSQLPQMLSLDMGTVQTLRGFSIVPNYSFGITIDFLDMEVMSSLDGKSWKMEGIYKGTATSASSSKDNPDSKTVKFINPVTARYFRFNILSSSYGSYTGMGELYGIK